MTRSLTLILQWARRVRDFLVEHDLRSDLAELTPLRQELDDVVGKLTANAAAQETLTKQSRVQTTEIRRLRNNLRNVHLKPIVRMSRTMQLEINGTEITFALPRPSVDSERLAATGDAMVNALKVVGQKFIARGFASNFVEQLAAATKALRDAVDRRSAQVGQRAGTTAAMAKDGSRAVQLVRVIDPLVRPVIENDPELLATWENVVALPPRSPKAAGGVVATAVGVTSSPTLPTGSTDAGHAQQAAA